MKSILPFDIEMIVYEYNVIDKKTLHAELSELFIKGSYANNLKFLSTDLNANDYGPWLRQMRGLPQ